ncbi:MAG: hypothetical protein QM668_15125 [Agriterribacter sp.]
MVLEIVLGSAVDGSIKSIVTGTLYFPLALAALKVYLATPPSSLGIFSRRVYILPVSKS